jgi:hypothetical protein
MQACLADQGFEQGHQYFDAEEKHGVLVVPAKVRLLDV